MHFPYGYANTLVTLVPPLPQPVQHPPPAVQFHTLIFFFCNLPMPYRIVVVMLILCFSSINLPLTSYPYNHSMRCHFYIDVYHLCLSLLLLILHPKTSYDSKASLRSSHLIDYIYKIYWMLHKDLKVLNRGSRSRLKDFLFVLVDRVEGR